MVDLASLNIYEISSELIYYHNEIRYEAVKESEMNFNDNLLRKH